MTRPSRRPDPAPAAQPTSSLRFNPDETGGVTVVRDGHPQSYVDLDDPANLGFDYLEHLAAILDILTPDPPASLAVTHVGGAGLSLARYVAHARPGSPQIVLEPDEAMTAAVRAQLPLPRGHRIRVRPVDGRSGMAGLRAASADAVVVDAYQSGQVPAELTTVEFFSELRRVLRPTGAVLVNLADEPDLRYVARVTAGVAQVFGAGLLIATQDVLKGRRFGNAVFVGALGPLDHARLRRRLNRTAYPAGMRTGDAVERLVRFARPLTDADAQSSPVPPDPGRWRVR